MTPQYKLIISYDIATDKHEGYYRYVLGEFVPALRTMGLQMTSAWHVSYGDYPARMLEFVIETREVWIKATATPRWKKLEERLQSYTENYDRKLILYKDGFQF